MWGPREGPEWSSWLWPEQEAGKLKPFLEGGQWEKSRFVEGEALRAGSAEQRLPVGVCVLEVGGHRG